MKKLPGVFLVFGALALTACSNDQPPPAPPPAPVVNHPRAQSRSSAAASSNNPDSFEPVERPASYSR